MPQIEGQRQNLEEGYERDAAKMNQGCPRVPQVRMLPATQNDPRSGSASRLKTRSDRVWESVPLQCLA